MLHGGFTYIIPEPLTHIIAQRIALDLFECRSPLRDGWKETLTWDGVCALSEVECVRQRGSARTLVVEVVNIREVSSIRHDGELERVYYHVRADIRLAEMIRPPMARHAHIELRSDLPLNGEPHL